MLYIVIIARKYKTRVYDIKVIRILRLFADYRDITYDSILDLFFSG
jgi:hypothetical protein